MIDLHPGVQLGKLPPKPDAPVVPFHKVFNTELPIPPDTGNRGGLVGDWPMFLNDQMGDCGPAGVGHFIQCARHFTGRPFDLTDDDVKAFYYAVTGGQDSGVVMTEMLAKWTSDGIKGDKCVGWLAVDPQNDAHVCLAINYLGGVLGGYNLPAAARVLPTWDFAPGTPLTGAWLPGSWGGHCVYHPDYSGAGSLGLVFPGVTWAMVKAITRSFLRSFCDEMYVVILQDWLDATGHSPHGLDVAALKSEMAALGQPT